MADSVEREILIDAAPEVVWRVITQPEQVSQWFTDDADFESRSGAEGAFTWTRDGRNGKKQADVVVPIEVVDAEPFRRFAFRWNHAPGTRPDESNSALVEFSLAREEGGTRLTVVESGIDAVTADEAAKTHYMADHERGWEKHLGELVDYLASQESSGTPR